MNGKKAFWYAVIGGVVVALIVVALIVAVLSIYDQSLPTPSPSPISYKSATCGVLSPVYGIFDAVPYACPDRPKTARTEIFELHNENP